jgi:hypothetical protein
MHFCYTLLHAGAATHLNICDSLPYYQPNTLAGAINNFFIVYPQKYENCSTLVRQYYYTAFLAQLLPLHELVRQYYYTACVETFKMGTD